MASGWTSTTGPASTNGLAIAAFVVSWIFWPAALLMGFVALLSHRRRDQTGRGWALAGIALSILWGAASVVVIAGVIGFLRSGELAALTGTSSGTSSDVQGIAVGQCFVDQGNRRVPTDCALPHDGEVFFTGTVVGTGTIGYPGRRLLQEEVEAMCDAAFASHVGLSYEESEWQYGTWMPDEDSWADGDRVATCAIVPLGAESLTGPAVGSAT